MSSITCFYDIFLQNLFIYFDWFRRVGYYGIFNIILCKILFIYTHTHTHTHTHIYIYIYIYIHKICKHILLIMFGKVPKLILLQMVPRYYVSQSIQFSISHSYTLSVKQFYLTHRYYYSGPELI